MRTIKLLLATLVLMVSFVLPSEAQNKNEKTIVFNANIHCAGCKDKVEKNIPFEKGVKALKVDMKRQTIAITFRTDKNTKENLIKAIEKYDVKILGEVGQTANCAKGDCDKCPNKGTDKCCNAKGNSGCAECKECKTGNKKECKEECKEECCEGEHKHEHKK